MSSGLEKLTSLRGHGGVSRLSLGLVGDLGGGAKLHLGFAAAIIGRGSRAVAVFKCRRLERANRKVSDDTAARYTDHRLMLGLIVYMYTKSILHCF